MSTLFQVELVFRYPQFNLDRIARPKALRWDRAFHGLFCTFWLIHPEQSFIFVRWR